MIRCVLWAVLTCLPVVTSLADEITRIAFGSCIKQQYPVPIFDSIIDQAPDVFVFLGDNIYADTEDMSVMKSKYSELKEKPRFSKLVNSCQVFATWDDHDYGLNDAGSEYTKREEARQLFLDFWGEPSDSVRRKTPGIYDSIILGEKPHRVQLILLDTRYFRGPLKSGERRVGGKYYPESTTASIPMLGEAQWAWLKDELKKPAEIRIVASSIQFVAEAAGQETWSNLPGEKQRMVDLIEETGADGLFFISGDRHWSEFSMMKDPGIYPIYDFTSSALNQLHQRGTPTENKYRLIDQTFHQANFGQIDIDWDKKPVELQVTIRNQEGRVQIEKRLSLDELKP